MGRLHFLRYIEGTQLLTVSLKISAPLENGQITGPSNSWTEVAVHRMRILLADDNAAIREMARQIIEENPKWTICGEAADGRMAVELARRLHPDIVVLDYKMPLMNGLQAAHLIGSFSPAATMVMFTAEATKQLVRQALASGIRTVVSKAGHGYLELLNLIEQISFEPRFSGSRGQGRKKTVGRPAAHRQAEH